MSENPMEEKVPGQEIRKKQYQLQINFGEEAYKELESLQQKTNKPSKSEVIRNALGVYRWVVDELSEGNKILVEKVSQEGENKVKEIVFKFLKIPRTSVSPEEPPVSEPRKFL